MEEHPLEKLLYHAERSVLASIASYPDGAHLAMSEMGNLWSEVFTTPTLVPVAHSIRDLLNAKRLPEWHNLAEALAMRGADPTILDLLRPHVESFVMIPDRCRTLRAGYTLRRLEQTANAIRFPGSRTVDELAEEAINTLTQATAAAVMSQSMSDSLQEVANLYRARRANPATILGVPSPWTRVNQLLLGFQAHRFYILGARPSHGKTAAACNIIDYAASAGFPVLVFSHEMDTQQLSVRLLASRAACDNNHILTGRLRNLEVVARFEEALVDLKALPNIEVVDRSYPPMQLQAMARSYAMRVGATNDRPLLVIIDYLQLEHIPNSQANRTEELARISGSWLDTIKSAPITLLALAQLNRGAATGEPILSQLRDSGALEQDAHGVLLLWRPGKDDATRPANLAWLNLAKNRGGPLGRVKLHFTGYSMTFRDWVDKVDIEQTLLQQQEAEDLVVGTHESEF
jgi:replicative DNA helicase